MIVRNKKEFFVVLPMEIAEKVEKGRSLCSIPQMSFVDVFLCGAHELMENYDLAAFIFGTTRLYVCRVFCEAHDVRNHGCLLIRKGEKMYRFSWSGIDRKVTGALQDLLDVTC